MKPSALSYLAVLLLALCAANVSSQATNAIPGYLAVDKAGEVPTTAAIVGYTSSTDPVTGMVTQRGNIRYNVLIGSAIVPFSLNFVDSQATKMLTSTGAQTACYWNAFNIMGFVVCNASLAVDINYDPKAVPSKVSKMAMTFSTALSGSDMSPLTLVVGNGRINAGITYTNKTTIWDLSYTTTLFFTGIPIQNASATFTQPFLSTSSDWSVDGKATMTVAVGNSVPTFSAGLKYGNKTKVLELSSSTTAVDLGGGFQLTAASLSGKFNLNNTVATMLEGLSISGTLTIANNAVFSPLSNVFSSTAVSLLVSYALDSKTRLATWVASGSVVLKFTDLPIKSTSLGLMCTLTNGTFVLNGTTDVTVDIGTAASPKFSAAFVYKSASRDLSLTGSVADLDLGSGFLLKTVSLTVELNLGSSSIFRSISLSATFTASGALSSLSKVLKSFSVSLSYTPADKKWALKGSTALSFSDSPVQSATLSVDISVANTTITFTGAFSMVVAIGDDRPTFSVSLTYATATSTLTLSGGLTSCVDLFGGFAMCNTGITVVFALGDPKIFKSFTISGTLKMVSGGAKALEGFFTGSLTCSFTVATRADVGFDFTIALRTSFTFPPDSIIIGGFFETSIAYKMSVPPQLVLTGKLGLQAKLGPSTSWPTFSCEVSYDLINSDLTITGRMVDCWEKPFGVNGLTVCDVVLGVGINMIRLVAALVATAASGGLAAPAILACFSKFEAGGGLILGSGERQKKFIFYVAIDTSIPTNNAFLANFVGSLNLFDIIDFGFSIARKIGIPVPSIPASVVYPITVSNILVKVCSREMTIAREVYKAGFALKGTVVIFGLTIQGEFELGPSGVSALLSLTPLTIGNGLLKIWRTSVDKTQGPLASFKAQWSPSIVFEVMVSGYAELLGISVEVILTISTTRCYFMVEAKFLNLFQAKLEFEANFAEIAAMSFTVTAEFRNDLFSKLREEARAAIQAYANAATAAINDAQAKVNAEKAKFDKAAADLQAKKVDVDRAIATLESKKSEVAAKQNEVNSLCPNMNCGSVCWPTTWWDGCCSRTASWCTGCSRCGGWSCRWRDCCTNWGGHCIGCVRTDWCGTRITDPICLAANGVCAALRAVANAALEVAKFALSLAQGVVNVGNGVLDALAAIVTAAKGILDAANGFLEGVKIMNEVGALVAQKISSMLLGGVFDITRLWFRATLSVANGGALLVNVWVSLLGAAAKEYSINVDFRSISNFAVSIWNMVKDSFGGSSEATPAPSAAAAVAAPAGAAVEEHYLSGWCGHAGSYSSHHDMNGDGMADLLCDDVAGNHWVAMSSGTDVVGSLQYQTGWCVGAGFRTQHADFNGDKMADMYCDGTNGQHWIKLSTGFGVGTEFYLIPGWCSHGGSYVSFADFNGDGKDDMFCDDVNGGHAVTMSTGSSYGPTIYVLTGSSCVNYKISHGDFNGDGKADTFCDNMAGHHWVFPSTGSSLAAGNNYLNNWCQEIAVHADMNGDGKSDLLCDYSNGEHHAFFSTGTSVVGAVMYKNGWCGHGGSYTSHADMDGDKKADLLCDDTAGNHWLRRSNGNGVYMMSGEDVMLLQAYYDRIAAESAAVSPEFLLQLASIPGAEAWDQEVKPTALAPARTGSWPFYHEHLDAVLEDLFVGVDVLDAKEIEYVLASVEKKTAQDECSGLSWASMKKCDDMITSRGTSKFVETAAKIVGDVIEGPNITKAMIREIVADFNLAVAKSLGASQEELADDEIAKAEAQKTNAASLAAKISAEAAREANVKDVAAKAEVLCLGLAEKATEEMQAITAKFQGEENKIIEAAEKSKLDADGKEALPDQFLSESDKAEIAKIHANSAEELRKSSEKITAGCGAAYDTLLASSRLELLEWQRTSAQASSEGSAAGSASEDLDSLDMDLQTMLQN